MTKQTQTRNNDDVKSVVDRFVMTVSQLQALLAKETDYLKVADRNSFLKLQDEKVAVAQNYQRDIFAVKNIAKTLKSKYPSLVPYLHEKQAGLSLIISENEKALKRMEKSTKRLTDRIMDIARETAIEKNSVAYGAAGELDRSKRASMGISESA
jgi:hypothetical protein